MYYDRIWSVEVRGKARKALKRFPAKDAGVILDVIEILKTDPFGGDIEKLGGEANAWRRRVGSYRYLLNWHQLTRSDLVIFCRVYQHSRMV